MFEPAYLSMETNNAGANGFVHYMLTNHCYQRNR